MKNEKNRKNIMILPYKDAHLNDIIEPEDLLKWLEDPNLKDDFDTCINKLRI